MWNELLGVDNVGVAAVTALDYEVEAGDSATFRCNAVYDQDLKLQIIWLKDGEPIDMIDVAFVAMGGFGKF